VSSHAANSDARVVDLPGNRPPATKEGLRSRAARGSAWTLGSFAIGNVLRLGSNLVLARVLFPEAFALVALASIVLQALQMFSDFGVGASIIQNPHGHEPRFLNTAWTLQAIRGVVLWLVTLALAWPVARFYSTPELLWIIPACGLSFVSTGLQSTAMYTSSRELRLGKITLMGLAETIIKTIITVVWALIWPSVWAIIGGSLISYTLFMIATHTMLPGIRNRFAWDPAAARQLLHFGGWVFLSTSVTFLAMQSDRLILGKLVSMDVLGVYSIAYMFSRLPADIAGQLASQVQFPALAEVFRKDPSRIEARLLESRRLLLAVSQFGALGIVIVSPWFFTLLYDSRYANAAVFAPMLAGVAWLALLQAGADRALLAMGDSKSLAMSNSLNAIVTIPACIGGHVLAGMPGFIFGVGLGNLAGHGVVIWALARRNVRVLAQDAAYTALVAGIGGAAAGIPLMFPQIAGSVAARIMLGAAGLMISGFCVLRLAAQALDEPSRVLWKRLTGGQRPSEAHAGPTV